MATLKYDIETFRPTGSYSGKVDLWGKVATTDDTVTQIVAIPVSVGEGALISGYLLGVQDDEADAVVVEIVAAATRAAAGNVTIEGTSAVRVIESDAATNATVTADTTNQTVDINVVGITAENWRWEFFGHYFKV